MATGMEMLFKSFGIDPAEIIKTAEGVSNSVGEMNAAVLKIGAALQSIDARLARIELALDVREEIFPPATANYVTYLTAIGQTSEAGA